MAVPIIQFGTSRFLQAHADFFLHEAAEAGHHCGPIAVVAGSGSAQGRARLAALADPAGFPVIVRGLRDGLPVEETTQVRSVRRALEAEAEWPELTRLFVDDAEFVISNTTEAGFAVPDGLRLDLSRDVETAPPSFPARLLALLAARWRAGRPGLVLLPTELVGRNGDTLKSIVLGLAAASDAKGDLVRWIETDCIFANSLVDRIVSAPIEPAGAVAEPYALWAIEDQPGLHLPCVHPAISIVADLEPVERLKIHILNLGHSLLAEHWLTHGSNPDTTVRAMLSQPEPAALLDRVYAQEIMPGFSARGMGEAAERYRDTTMERFRNPFLDHRIADIAGGHAAKIARRAGGFIAWVKVVSDLPMPTLSALSAKYPPPSG